MSNKENFEFFAEEMLNNAVKEFKETEQYKLLQEKLDQMDRDCDIMLTNEEKDFAVECFELLLAADGQQGHYVYRKELQDCVSVLKYLVVLA